MSHTVVTIIVWLFCLGHAADACDQPSDIEIPNGATASATDILATGARTSSYMTAMAAYVNCLEAAIRTDQQHDNVGAGAKYLANPTIARRNAALEKMTEKYSRFEKAVEEFELRARM